MPKKPLKVQAARTIYTPKYPSYKDKNPLLYPETRPYPFRHKFIKWMSTGGLASMMLFSGNSLYGQEAPVDTLFNPFPLENARVPYQPVSFGTGMPERLKSADARQAILKAFAAEGIELEKEVWLEDGSVGVFLDGYSAKEEIGFVLMDYYNMDESFKKVNRIAAKHLRQMENPSNKNNDLKKEIKEYQDQVKKSFLRFVKEKPKVLAERKNYTSNEGAIRFTEQLLALEPKMENESLFNAYYLQSDLGSVWDRFKAKDVLAKAILKQVEDRFPESIEQRVLLSYIYRFRKSNKIKVEFYEKLASEFKAIEKIRSDEKFLASFLILHKFLMYKSRLHTKEAFVDLKIEIMNAYPLKKWFKNLGKLDEYYDKNFLSLKEARRIDLNNKKGTQFIAPISLRDELMVIRGNQHFDPEDLREEQIKLTREFNEKNGMTPEILARRKAEFKELSERYSYQVLKDLPKEKKNSLRQIQQEERKEIIARYKAMEQMSEEDRAAFKLRSDDLQKRIRERRSANQEEIQIETLRRLEEEVKLYIKWAKSQMGS